MSRLQAALVGGILVILTAGVVVGGVMVFAFEDSTNHEAPLYNSQGSFADGAEFNFSGGQWTNQTFVLNKNPNSSYLLRVDLTQFAGYTGSNALQHARQGSRSQKKQSGERCRYGSGSFIVCFMVENSTKGVDEEIRRDLLGDGSAFYYHVPKNGTGELTFKVRSTDSGTVKLSRTPYMPDEISIRNHRKVGARNCSGCHASKYPPQVHQDMGATQQGWVDYESNRCADCHDNTMMDIHQDCDTACHDEGYPIVANEDDPDEPKKVHDPNSMSDPDMIQGEYFCSSDTACHAQGTIDKGWGYNGIPTPGGVGQAHVQEYNWDAKDEQTGFCTRCHNDVDPDPNNNGETMAITNLHYGYNENLETGCPKCHGGPLEYSHQPAWNSGWDSNSMKKCGTDGCH